MYEICRVIATEYITRVQCIHM